MNGETFTSTFWELISADMYIVVAAVYGVCFALKKAKFFDDRFIPLAALALGILFQTMTSVAVGLDIPSAVLKGIVCGMAAVFAANVVKQIGGDKNDSDEI